MNNKEASKFLHNSLEDAIAPKKKEHWSERLKYYTQGNVIDARGSGSQHMYVSYDDFIGTRQLNRNLSYYGGVDIGQELLHLYTADSNTGYTWHVEPHEVVPPPVVVETRFRAVPYRPDTPNLESVQLVREPFISPPQNFTREEVEAIMENARRQLTHVAEGHSYPISNAMRSLLEETD